MWYKPPEMFKYFIFHPSNIKEEHPKHKIVKWNP